MYAIVKCGGKQLKVAKGDQINVELQAVDAGAKITLADVMLIADGEKITVGSPLVAGAKVLCEVVSHGKGPKVIAFKKRRRQNSRRKIGHRQPFSVLKITGIEVK